MRASRAAMLIGVAALAGLLWVFDFFPFDNEQGIRVKNGSVDVVALSHKGFKEAGRGFKSRAKTKGCYMIVVTGGDCGSNNVRDIVGAARFTFYRGAVGQLGEDERDAIAFWNRRFKLAEGDGWAIVGEYADLRYESASDYLTRVTATGSDGQTLDCTNADEKAAFDALATPMSCPP